MLSYAGQRCPDQFTNPGKCPSIGGTLNNKRSVTCFIGGGPVNNNRLLFPGSVKGYQFCCQQPGYLDGIDSRTWIHFSRYIHKRILECSAQDGIYCKFHL